MAAALSRAQVDRRAEVMIGVLPIGTGPGSGTPQVSLFWSLPALEAHAFAAGDFEAWKSRVARFWPEAGALAVRDWVFTPASLLPILRGLCAAMLVGSLRIGPWPKGTRP